jgi:hypothetical protein
MSEAKKSKPEIELEIQKIFQVAKAIDQKLDAAKASGDKKEVDSLIDDLRLVKDREEFLQNEFSLLEEQEAKPQKEQISKLGQELRTPYERFPAVNLFGFMPYINKPAVEPFGLMPYINNPAVQPTAEEDRNRKREIIGQLYNAPINEGGRIAEQLPAGVRAGVGALPTPESELQYLQKTYPDANIAPIDVGGNTEYLIKNKDGTSFTTLDKGIAGTAGMLAVEAPLAVAEVGASLGTLAATKSPITATLAGGATRATLGPIADSITRAALGMEQSVGESLLRRGTEAGIGTALGIGIDVIPASVIASRVPSNFKNEFLKTYQQSVKRLDLPSSAIPAGSQFGKQGLEAAQELSGQFPKSGIASNMRKTQESIRTLFEGMRKNIPATPNDFSSIAVNLNGQRRALSNSIARNNDKSVSLIQDTVSRILKPRAKTNLDDLGNFFRNTIASAEDQAVKSTEKQYDVLANVANQAGFQITAKELIDILPDIKSRINPGGAFDDAAVKGVENRLREVRDAPMLIAAAKKELAKAKTQGRRQDLTNEIKRLEAKNKPLDFRAFDAYIRAFNDARPDGGAVGGSTKDVFGVGVSAELSALRRDIYSRFNATFPDGNTMNLGDEFQKAAELVKARSAFKGNTLGGALREIVGEQATTPRDIVSSIMKEPFTVNRVLQAAKMLELDDPAQAGVANKMQEMMRLQYLNDLGMGSKKGVPRLDYDQGMLDALYGDKSNLAAKGLDSLNNKLKILKSANVPEMTLTDLNAFSSALSQDARDKIADGIIKRTVLEKQEQDLVRSSIFKAAQKGNFENIDPDLLSRSILSKDSSISQVQSTMLQLSQASLESRNLFKGDFIRNLLDEYPGGAPSASAPYTPIFDAKKLLSEWDSPTGKSQLAKKVEIVLGQSDAQFIYDLAKIYDGNTIADIAAKSSGLRTIRGESGTTFILPIGPIVSAAKNRYLAAMLSTGSDRYGLKSALARNALPGEVNDAYLKMYKGAFTTRQGITALANQASSDPEFSAELQNAFREFEKKENLQSVQD